MAYRRITDGTSLQADGSPHLREASRSVSPVLRDLAVAVVGVLGIALAFVLAPA